MSYGEIKIDTITFTAGGVDTSIAVSGLVQNPTFTGNITTTGTISGDIIRGNTISGVTVTGGAGEFGSLTAVSGVFTTQVSGATVTGNVGLFTTITGGTVNLTSGIFASGTAAAPSVSIGTTDNGLYSPGADQVAISTNGTGRLFVDSAGQVGVGLSPSYRFDVAGPFRFRAQGYLYDTAGTSQLIRFTEIGARDARMDAFNGTDFNGTLRYAGANLLFETGTSASVTERLRITSDGKVGVGTSSPAELLELSATDNPRIRFVDVGNTDAKIGIYASGRLGFEFGGTERMSLNSTGLGVGTTTPTLKLSVDGDLWNGNGSGAEVGRLFNDPAGVYHLRASSNMAGLAFGTNGTEKARIDNSGRLGIGTSSPSTRLEVQDNSTLISLKYANDAGSALLSWKNTAGTTLWSIGGGIATEQDELAFVRQGTTVAKFDSSGRLGIGTSSPNSALHVAGTGSPAIQVQTTGANQFGYFIAKSPNREYHFGVNDSSSGSFYIYDNTAAATRLAINSSGNVGIGTQSPGGQLDVSGTSDTRVITRESGNSVRTDLMSQTTQGGVGTTSNHPFFIQTNGSERCRVDTSGRLLVGTSSSPSAGNGQYAKIAVQGNTATNSGEAFLSLQRGEAATAITSGVGIGQVNFGDSNGNSFAFIQCLADANAGSGDYPGRLVFSTCPDSSATPVERMRIASDGRVTVKGGGTGTTIALSVTDSADTALFNVRNDGLIGTGTTTNSPYNFTTASAANMFVDSGGLVYRSTSSLKYKKNVADAQFGLQELLALRPVTYQSKTEADGETVYAGLIAEEVDAAGLQEFVQYADDGSPDALAYGNMIALCIKAIQEQQAVITELQVKVAALESA